MFSIKKKNISYYLLFLIWPLFSVIIAFKNRNWVALRNTIWLFSGFFGYTFVTQFETMDAFRHRENFVNIANYGSFQEFFSNIYVTNGEVDVLLIFIKYFIAIFTANPDVFYAVLGLTFGYFYSGNIVYFLKEVDGKIFNKYVVVSFLLVTFTIAVWEINSFRYWTGAHLIIYFILKSIFEGEKKYFHFILFAPFIHYALLLVVFLLYLYKYFGNRITIYFYLFVASLFITNIDLSFLAYYIDLTEVEVLEYRALPYLSEDYREMRLEQADTRNWYAQYYYRVLIWVTNIFVILLYALKSKLIISYNEKKLYSIGLILLSFGNALMSVPAVGSRSIRIGIIFFYFLIGIVLYKHQIKSKLISLYLPIFYISIIFYLIVHFRIGAGMTNILVLIGNPFIVILTDLKFALIELVK